MWRLLAYRIAPLCEYGEMRVLIAAVAMIVAMFLAGLVMDRNISTGSAFLFLSFAIIVIFYVVSPGRD